MARENKLNELKTHLLEVSYDRTEAAATAATAAAAAKDAEAKANAIKP